MRGFLGAKRWESLDLKDLTVEIVVTHRLPRPLEAINSGSNNVEILCYLSDICSKTRTFPRLHAVFQLFIRLVMSSLSRPTSSSSTAPSPLPVRSSSSLSSSSSSGSSITDSLSAGVVQVPHPVEVVRGDDSANVVEWSGSLSKSSPGRSLIVQILR